MVEKDTLAQNSVHNLAEAAEARFGRAGKM